MVNSKHCTKGPPLALFLFHSGPQAPFFGSANRKRGGPPTTKYVGPPDGRCSLIKGPLVARFLPQLNASGFIQWPIFKFGNRKQGDPPGRLSSKPFRKGRVVTRLISTALSTGIV